MTTATTTLTLERADAAAEFAENHGDCEIDVRPAYSGRGMYGDETIGFVYDNPRDLMLLGVGLVEEGVHPDDLPSRHDSMGRSYIVY